jgi:hypothetical protein
MNEGFNREQIDNLKNREVIYVKNFNRFVSNVQSYSNILSLIKTHSFDNFKVDDKSYCIEVTPDDNFLKLISDLNEHIDSKVNLDKIIFFISKDKENLIDIETNLPDILKGSSIGYKLYKLLINKFDYISSNKHASPDALNLWYNLLMDDDLYCITSNYFSYVIDKKISDDKLKEIIANVKNRNEVKKVEYDDDITAHYYKITSKAI